MDNLSLRPSIRLSICLSVCGSGSPYQPNGEGFHCLRVTYTPPCNGRRGGDGKARLNRDGDLIFLDPPVVTSNAGIPEMRGRCKQGWALSKRGSQCSRAGASWSWGETKEVLCQDCDTEYQWNSTEEEERQGGGIRIVCVCVCVCENMYWGTGGCTTEVELK